MKTTLPPGTWVKTRYQGNWEYGKVSADGEGLIGGWPPKDAMIQPCVWKKGDSLEPRGKPQRYTGPQPPPPNPLVEQRLQWTMDQLVAEKEKVDADMKDIIGKALEAQQRGDMVTYMKHMEALKPLAEIEQANSCAAITQTLMNMAGTP